MSLIASCPRCTSPVAAVGSEYSCLVHGSILPLWRPEQVDYDSFAELVAQTRELPTLLPWPMSPGWSIADFGCVGGDSRATATTTTTVGTSDLDGAVEISVVSENPGVGLGRRCAGTSYDDPGMLIGRGRPAIHVRVGGRTVPLWLLDDLVEDEEILGRAVFAGEAEGRWLWLAVRPASAALLLHDDWWLADVTGFGPQALEMPFGGRRPRW